MAIPSNFLTKVVIPAIKTPIPPMPLTAKEFAEKYSGRWVSIDIYRNPGLKLRPPYQDENDLQRFGKAYVMGHYHPMMSDKPMVICHVDPSCGIKWRDLPQDIRKAISISNPNILIEDSTTIMALSASILVPPESPVDIRAKYPHDCYCGAPCFKMYSSVECSSMSCRHYGKGNC